MLTGAWIIALLMSGAPILALAGGADAEAEDKGDGEDDLAAEQQEPDSSGDGAREEAEPPTDYEFILELGGNHGIEGFRPSTDTLTLTSDTWDFELYDLGDDGNGAGLEIVLGDERSILRFRGLAAVPVDDVYLHVSEPGEPPQLIALRDTLNPAEDEVLAPADPDAPDELPPSTPEGSPVAPSDPDTPDALPDAPWSGEPLAPTDPDAPES